MREIEGDSCLVTWKRNEQLTIPRFLDTGRCPFSDNQPVLQREGHHSRDERNQTISKSVVQCSETDDPTRAEETGLSDEKGVQTVMCGTNDVESDQGTVTIVLPVKCMEDVGCQTSLSDDDPECGQCYAVSTKETETEKQPDCHSDVIGRSDSRVCVSETSSVSSSEHMESPAVPVSLVEIQTEGATVKASSPVREMKRVSLSLPASTPVDSRRTSLLAETVHLEPPRGDTRVRVSDDSTLISVTQMSSTWPSDDSGHSNTQSSLVSLSYMHNNNNNICEQYR